jgi:hypothetical protein
MDHRLQDKSNITYESNIDRSLLFHPSYWLVLTCQQHVIQSVLNGIQLNVSRPNVVSLTFPDLRMTKHPVGPYLSNSQVIRRKRADCKELQSVSIQ